MPPIAKFKKEEIVDCALNIIESKGLNSLTARSLGKSLGSSPRPIFTIFNTMEEVIDEAIKKSYSIYQEYLAEGLQNEYPFKGTGIAYIKFASEHPKLFQLLFMSEAKDVPNIHQALISVEENYNQVLASIMTSHNLDKVLAEKLYQHLWIYTHGIAVLIATKVCKFSPIEISNMLTEIFVSLLKNLKDRGE